MSLFKAQAHMMELKQRLSLLISGAVFTESVDSNGMPTLQLVASGETIFIHIETEGNAGRVDGLGMPQRAYSPHKVQILRDSDTITSQNVRDIALISCGKLGMKMEIWGQATLPSSFDLTSATLALTLPSNEIHGLTMSQ